MYHISYPLRELEYIGINKDHSIILSTTSGYVDKVGAVQKLWIHINYTQ